MSPRARTLRRLASLLVLLGAICAAQSNGNLQIHFMDVGQGDGAVLISPAGEVVLFDNGVRNNCDRPVSYLQQLGVTKVDYHLASHYHDDHIGCTTEVLTNFPLEKQALDRGGKYYTATYQKYVGAVGAKRTTAELGKVITLDSGTSSPVTIRMVAVNANGISTTNENDLSLVALVRFGQFEAIIGGDLSGFKSDNYEDIESSVAGSVGEVEVYKVHHHGSRYSTNEAWLDELKPLVGIISAGEGNVHRHPTQECLERLHQKGVKTYWTTVGNGATPEPGYDIIGGNIIVEVVPNSTRFTVTYSGTLTDTFPLHGATPDPIDVLPDFAWSKKSEVYHHATCRYVENISPWNLERGASPPVGKRLHKDCPIR